jgi:hypothetical protein
MIVRVSDPANQHLKVRVSGRSGSSYYQNDDSLHVTFDLNLRSVVYTGSQVGAAEIEKLSAGVFKLTLNQTYSSGTPTAYAGWAFRLSDQSDASDYNTSQVPQGSWFEFTACQREELVDSPSSYIPTAGTQVTRAADDCVRVLGDEFNAGEFTLYCEGQQLGDTSNFATSTFISLGAAAGGTITFVAVYDDIRFLTYNTTGVANTDYRFVGLGGNNLHKMAVSWKSGNTFYGVSVNGVYREVQLTGEIDPALLTRITVSNIFASDGSSGSNQTSRALSREIKAFPTALSEAELITLTGGN